MDGVSSEISSGTAPLVILAHPSFISKSSALASLCRSNLARDRRMQSPWSGTLATCVHMAGSGERIGLSRDSR
jgi:hypothetical protein